MKLFLILFLSFGLINLFSANLLNEEIYWNADKSQVLGKKKYIYDDKKNILSIETYNQDLVESKYEYIYDNDILVLCNELSGKVKLKYSVFSYEKNLPISKVEYDYDNKPVLIHKYFYENGNIKTIEDYLPDTKNPISYKIFIYEKGVIIEEKSLDQNKSLLLSKKYYYKNNLISQIDFIHSSGRKIRIIERVYGDGDIKINSFGFSTNFVDLR